MSEPAEAAEKAWPAQEDVWRVCRVTTSGCDNCPAKTIEGGEDYIRGCYLQAVECINVVETGNPWRKTEGVRSPWAVKPASNSALSARVAELEKALRFYAFEWTVPAIGPRGEPEPTMRLERDQGAVARRALTAAGVTGHE